MSFLTLSRHGAVWQLLLTNNDNRLNDASVQAWHEALDQVEASEGNTALVITADSDKFFSNGIDLDGILAQHDMSYLIQQFVPKLDALLLRLARLPLPVVVAMNGHAYGGGALIAATADFRVMRADRGRFCFPEVDVKLPFTPLMMSVVKLLPSAGAAWKMAVTGAAWGGEEALKHGVIDVAVAGEQVLPVAMDMATALATKDRKTYGKIKQDWRAELTAFM